MKEHIRQYLTTQLQITDPELQQEIYAMYMQDMTDGLQQLAALAEAGKWLEASRRAHGLKGMAATIGDLPMQQVLRRLEECCANGAGCNWQEELQAARSAAPESTPAPPPPPTNTTMSGKASKADFEQELQQVSQQLSARTGEGKQRMMRMHIWHFTVAMSYKMKRLFDFTVALVALIVLSPLFLVLAIALRLTSPGPVIFSQIRVGRFGRHFRFYKFRSMYIDAEARKDALLNQNQSADGVIFKMHNDPRITPLGRILRKTSMDELPQLFNVLIGDMSLVGPRPPLVSEVQQYTLEDRKRLNVIPGLTCLWQISGRSDIPFSQQVKLDKEYILSRSLWQDLWILIRTVPAIIIGRGAY